MLKIHLIAVFFVLAATAGCDFTVPRSNEGMVAVTDSSAVSVDSSFAYDSSSRAGSTMARRGDNTNNKDTIAALVADVVKTKDVHPNELVSFAETLIGIPYRYGSTDPKTGFDCSGFITYVFNHFGIKVPRSSIDFTHVGKEIPLTESKRGDIILFTGTDSSERFVGHMGIITGNTDSVRFIHATSGKQHSVTITPLNNYYMGRFVKTIRMFKQNDE
jgi:cell wall-associated NlpC family hydrolase